MNKMLHVSARINNKAVSTLIVIPMKEISIKRRKKEIPFTGLTVQGILLPFFLFIRT
jgi:hypothetical protein